MAFVDKKVADFFCKLILYPATVLRQGRYITADTISNSYLSSNYILMVYLSLKLNGFTLASTLVKTWHSDQELKEAEGSKVVTNYPTLYETPWTWRQRHSLDTLRIKCWPGALWATNVSSESDEDEWSSVLRNIGISQNWQR